VAILALNLPKANCFILFLTKGTPFQAKHERMKSLVVAESKPTGVEG